MSEFKEKLFVLFWENVKPCTPNGSAAANNAILEGDFEKMFTELEKLFKAEISKEIEGFVLGSENEND